MAPEPRGRSPRPAAEGVAGLRLARAALDAAVRGEPYPPAASAGTSAPFLEEKRGVFVTLLEYPSDDLRGCIGFPLPHFPLREGIPQAARAAALEDPRFPPVRPSELDRVVVELSILTVPEPVPGSTPEERVRGVTVGVHGLIVDGFGTSGLLLPQVAPEQGWDAERFLAGTCEKAGLPSRAWREPGVRVRRFQARIYREAAPHGEVVERPA
jgi:uncharacterized protein (TIGR00296 family)